MLKSLEIKGFIGGNIKNEIRNRYLKPVFMNLHKESYNSMKPHIYWVRGNLISYVTCYKLL